MQHPRSSKLSKRIYKVEYETEYKLQSRVFHVQHNAACNKCCKSSFPGRYRAQLKETSISPGGFQLFMQGHFLVLLMFPHASERLIISCPHRTRNICIPKPLDPNIQFLTLRFKSSPSVIQLTLTKSNEPGHTAAIQSKSKSTFSSPFPFLFLICHVCNKFGHLYSFCQLLKLQACFAYPVPQICTIQSWIVRYLSPISEYSEKYFTLA